MTGFAPEIIRSGLIRACTPFKNRTQKNGNDYAYFRDDVQRVFALLEIDPSLWPDFVLNGNQMMILFVFFFGHHKCQPIHQTIMCQSAILMGWVVLQMECFPIANGLSFV